MYNHRPTLHNSWQTLSIVGRLSILNMFNMDHRLSHQMAVAYWESAYSRLATALLSSGYGHEVIQMIQPFLGIMILCQEYLMFS